MAMFEKLAIPPCADVRVRRAIAMVNAHSGVLEALLVSLHKLTGETIVYGAPPTTDIQEGGE